MEERRTIWTGLRSMRFDRVSARVLGCAVLATLLAMVSSGGSSADDPLPQATPEELGLLLPTAPPVVGDGRPVIVPSLGSEPLIGKVYVQVGDRLVVLLPNGQLISVPESECTPTDRPFRSATKEELADELTQGRFQGFRTRATRRYLCVYDSSDEFAKATSQILETMYPPVLRYFQSQKIPVRDPELPLVVIIFRTQDDFAKYREMPPGLAAYYNSLSNHIVMFEQSRLAEIAPELAFRQSVSTIAHEGIHQILHNIGVQQRLSRWPLWFSEGLAEYFAPTEVDPRRVRWKGVGLVNDLRLHELAQFYEQNGHQTTQGRLLRETVEAKSLNSLGYAAAWAVVNYHATRERDAFRRCLQDVSQLGPLQSVVPGSFYARHFGSDYAKREDELTDYLRSLPYVNPIDNQTHYVLMLAGQTREVLVTPSPAKLREHIQNQAANRVYQIQAYPNRAMAELIAKQWLSLP